MNRYGLNFKKIAEFFLVAAAFLLCLRTKQFMPIPFFHLADVAVILSIFSALLDKEFRNYIRENFSKFIFYWKLVGVIVIFILLGQIFSFLRFEASLLSRNVVADYLRLAINLGVFFIAALMVYKNPRLLRFITIAIIASFLLIVPVHIFSNNIIYFSASRLSGLMENSIIFGAWVSVSLILCIGLILETTKFWERAVLGVWLTVLSSFFWWSGARTAWISMILAVILFVFILLKQKRWDRLKMFLFITIFAFVAGYFLIGNNSNYNVSRQKMQSYLKSRATELVIKPDTYYENRISFWRENLSEIYNFPFGFGFKDPLVKNRYPGFVSTFLEVAVYGGVFALGIFLIFLGMLGKKIILGIKYEIVNSSQYLKISWFVIGVVLLVNIIPFNFFLVRVLWFAFGIIAGIVLKENKMSNI